MLRIDPEAIRLQREYLGLTQMTLAVKAGLHVATISHIEAGYTPNPPIRTVGAIAQALGVAIEAITKSDD